MTALRSRRLSHLLQRPAGSGAGWGALLAALTLVMGALVGGCASRSQTAAVAATDGGARPPQTGFETGAAPADADLSSGGDGATGATAAIGATAASGHRPVIGQDLATRHALFRVSAFDGLPGWRQDKLDEAWAAFRESCRALERKPGWKPLCAQVKSIQDPQARRVFLEREFALLTVQNTDRSREGEITGYYEPLLQGRAQRDARFHVPVYGVPNDLYTLDWKQVPASLRKAVVHVRPSGRQLALTQAGQPGAIRMDLRRFRPDTLDRRLRVRIQGQEALPYLSRAEIGRRSALDAPVLAWVDDPVALYAMQVQGTGRIRMADGQVLRLQYADQNGHPFKPMQLAAQGRERVQTRGAGEGMNAADEDVNIEHFDLVDDAFAAVDAAEAVPPDEGASQGDVVTRGRQTGGTGVADGDVAAAVEALTPRQGARAAGARAGVAQRPVQRAPAASSNQVVDDLLAQAQSGKKDVPAQARQQGARPATLAGKVGASVTGAAPATITTAALTRRQRALEADPSYVFFRIASDQSKEAGPVGALGVPLTAGRSLAVDPRVLPLGYPVFLDAAPGGRRAPDMQRLMFAQDTGGAIRGAVRADYFWGFGADAGKQARRTKQKGRMWVLVPHAEVQSLLSSKLVTRGAGNTAVIDRECLVDDETFCDDADAPDAGQP